MKKIDRFLLFFVGLGVWSLVSVLILKPSYLSAERHTAKNPQNHVHVFEDIRVKGFEDKTLIDAFRGVSERIESKLRDHEHGVQDIVNFFWFVEVYVEMCKGEKGPFSEQIDIKCPEFDPKKIKPKG